MSNSSEMPLKDKSEELKVLLKEIKDLYEPAEDESLNEMFFISLSKANEFSNTLEYLVGKM